MIDLELRVVDMLGRRAVIRVSSCSLGKIAHNFATRGSFWSSTAATLPADQQYDVAIVGGGHNALVCAAYLGKAGLKCVVLESRQILGGAAVTEELFPGFKCVACMIHWFVCSVCCCWLLDVTPKKL